MSVLRIAFPDTGAPGHCQWSLAGGNAAPVSGEGPPRNLPRALVKRASRVQLVVSAAHVLITRMHLPPSARRGSGSLLAFAVEERTACEPAANQVTLLGAAGDAEVVAVVDRKSLQDWRAALGVVGIHELEACAETLMLPLPPGGWSLAWDGREGFVRTGELEGGATDCGDRSSPPLSLQLMLADARARNAAPGSIALHLSAADAAPDIEAWQRILGVALRAAPAWDWRTAPAASAHDLFPAAGRWRIGPDTAARLRPVAWIAAAALGIHILALGADWARLASEQRTLRARMESSFRAAFPEALAVADPVVQMRRKLAQARHAAGKGDDGDFLPLIAKAAAGLRDLPAANLYAVSYESGRMTLEVAAGDPASVRRIVARFAEAGLSVATRSAAARAGKEAVAITLESP